MVCNRCKTAVWHTMQQCGLHPTSVELGAVDVSEDKLDESLVKRIKEALLQQGFEWLDSYRERIIERIKLAVIQRVRQPMSAHKELTLSAYLQHTLHQDYSTLSKLFSEVTSTTIERFYIEQRVERVKELLTYEELTLSQIAVFMQYSSTAYLSAQFKSITGMTPSQFKKMKRNTRRALDEI